MKHLVTGFMGAGKSSLIQLLREKKEEGRISPSLPVLDLDEEIESFMVSEVGATSIKSYVEHYGMEKFRELEFLVFKKLLQTLDHHEQSILALGGGTLHKSSWEFLKDTYAGAKDYNLVWIHRPIADCYETIEKTSDTRPLSSLGREELEKLYNKRLKYYCQCNYRMESQEVFTKNFTSISKAFSLPLKTP